LHRAPGRVVFRIKIEDNERAAEIAELDRATFPIFPADRHRSKRRGLVSYS
jgi:hypothetical protein